MKVKCCHNCIVDPICTAGCDELWTYYKSMEQKLSKWLKIMKISLNSMILFSLSHGLMVLTEFSVPSESHSYYTIEYLGLTYWYWWFIVIYMIPFAIYLYFMIHRILIKKIMHKISGGKRTFFIAEKRFEEVRDKLLQ